MTSTVRVPPYFDGTPLCEPWRDVWIIRAPVTYYRVNGHVTVPELFVTDFASIPSLVWPIIHPTDPRILLPSLAHDRAYEDHSVTRSEADFILWEAMGAVEEPASRWLRWHVWAAVRMGGGMSYATGPARQQERRAAYGAWVRAQTTG
jgi:hypothetical protein